MRTNITSSGVRVRWVGVVVCLSVAFSAVHAASISADLPSGQPVGTPVQFTVTEAGAGAETDYRLLVGRFGVSPYRLVYDYRGDNVFEWTVLEEGLYFVRGIARNRNTEVQTTADLVFLVTPRATTDSVVTSTDHPLVPIYSAPPCTPGNQMRVIFQAANSTRFSRTGTRPCLAGQSHNFYIAGMRQTATYFMTHEILGPGGNPISYGPVHSYLTGEAPEGLMPERTIVDFPDLETSVTQNFILMSGVAGGPGLLRMPFAFDWYGRVVWYDDRRLEREPWLYRLVEGGTLLMSLADEAGLADQVLQEVDLGGRTVRETNAARITEQLEALGHTDPFTSFHHEAQRLPNGNTIVLGSNERFVEDLQGPGLVDVIGDYIVELDRNWQVTWVWNGFDHLPLDRLAILNEDCENGDPGCPPVLLAAVANDWLHSNSVSYAPDGNLIVSVRHQDWVIKIDFQDGAGSGAVIWRLGPGGDFTPDFGDPTLWLSHQHDASYIGPDQILVFDNANTVCGNNPPLPNCYSRGQVYEVDETNLTLTLGENFDLGHYARAVGSAQRLANGNWFFDASRLGDFPPFSTRLLELKPDGTVISDMSIDMLVYRAYRLGSFYEPK